MTVLPVQPSVIELVTSACITTTLQVPAACAFITRDQELSSSRRLSAQTRHRTHRTRAYQQPYSAQPGVVRGLCVSVTETRRDSTETGNMPLQGSQTGLGSTSTRLSDRPGTLSAVVCHLLSPHLCTLCICVLCIAGCLLRRSCSTLWRMLSLCVVAWEHHSVTLVHSHMLGDLQSDCRHPYHAIACAALCSA